ncbi:MAG: FtsQ-type POTRA domain-containing protein [Patescibacteria group bacterium]
MQRPIFWIVLLILLLLSSASYFILFFPGFQVSHIKISGYKKVSSQEIEDIILSNLDKKFFGSEIIDISSKSIFIVDTKKIIGDIKNKFPIIEEVNIKRELPNIISLTITEREPFTVFCDSGNKCFQIDKNGVIFEEAQHINRESVVLRREANQNGVYIGAHVASKSTIDAIFKVVDNLKNNFNISTTEVLISNPLILKTSENWKIYFNLDSDIKLQITKMNSLLENEITESERKTLNYIYLQYKDRAYYK